MPSTLLQLALSLDDPEAELVPRLCAAIASKSGADISVPDLFRLGLAELARLHLAPPPVPPALTAAAPALTPNAGADAVDAATDRVLKGLRTRPAARPAPKNGRPRAD